MKLVKLEPALDPKNGAMGTLVLLKLILSTRSPSMGTYENQKVLYRITKSFEAYQNSTELGLNDDDYSWIMGHLKTADYSGMVVGKMLDAFENATEGQSETA